MLQIALLSTLLIAPEGIEITLTTALSVVFRALLIAPEGIEIFV